MPDEFDVLISGYGPTGLATASLLARRGHRVAVFERWPTLYGAPRMATIDGESARIIQAAANIDTALKHSIARPRYLFADEAGHILVDHDWNKRHICGFPFRISIHQPDIEDAIDAAARQCGAEINQGWEVVALEQDAAGVTLTARERIVDADSVRWGKSRVVRGKYLVGADGARSKVRELLGIERETWPNRNAWLTFDATRMHELPNLFGLSPDGRVAVIFCAPDGRAHSIIPLGENHVRFNFTIDPDTPHDGKLDRGLAFKYLREVYGLDEGDLDVYRQAIYPFEGKLSTTWRQGRVFLAGDAAHLMTPFQGQGGCSGLRDAINLAWKLDLVLNGTASAGLLDTYEAERKPHTRVYIDNSDKLANYVFTNMSDKPPTLQPDPVLLSGILHHGPDGKHAAPVGEIGPQGRIAAHKTGRFDDVFGWGFQLLGWRHDPRDHLPPDLIDFLRRIDCKMVRLDPKARPGSAGDTDGDYGRYFAQYGIEAVLMRPDFTVFGVAQSVDSLPALVADLRNRLGSR